MRSTKVGSRWTTPRQHYRGSWQQNPWINAARSASQARSETDGGSTASLVAECAADRERAVLSGSVTSQHNDGIQQRQQKAAMRTWENEGGRVLQC
jgi:hypothetical protein